MSTLERVVSAIDAVSTKSARRHGNEYRAQCPAHGGKGMNLHIREGDKRVLFTCYSHHCDPKDIMEAVGLRLADVFYESLSKDEKLQRQIVKTKAQIEAECVHAYLIIAQLPTMKEKGIEPTSEDDTAIKKSLAVLKRHNFTQEDYFRIEERKQAAVDARYRPTYEWWKE